MYYVEQIRNGVLMCKTSPEGKWTSIKSTIELTDFEKILVKFCKNHYADRIVFSEWVHGLKTIYKEFYGHNPEEHPNDFRQCMFTKLLEVWLKVRDDNSGHNIWLKKLFESSFSKGIGRHEETPIERTICELCGQIQNSKYLDDSKIERYSLEVENTEWK